MCEICRRSICHQSCPNASEPEAVFICAECGEDICEGDEYYDVLGEQFCETCIEKFRRVAEYDPD